MTVVLAWTTTPEGQAAQETAVAEARRRSLDLVVVPMQEGSPEVAPEGVEVRVHAPDERDRDVVGDFLDIAAEEDASLIGSASSTARRSANSSSAPPPSRSCSRRPPPCSR